MCIAHVRKSSLRQTDEVFVGRFERRIREPFRGAHHPMVPSGGRHGQRSRRPRGDAADDAMAQCATVSGISYGPETQRDDSALIVRRSGA